jgi:hypothetical protein
MATPLSPVLGMLGMDAGSPYGTLAQGLQQASTDSKQLAALQWQRQMAGLSRALGYTQHSQAAFDNVYGHPGPAPGGTLPQGVQAPVAQSNAGPSGPGLQAYLGRGK